MPRLNSETFAVIEIDDVIPEFPEQLGTKEKFWLHIDQVRYLFKIGRPHTGENWAERAAAELCGLLGLPCASYELAVWKGRPGVLSRSIVPNNGRLDHGNELLAELHHDYPASRMRGNRDHTLGRIYALLSRGNILLPLDWQRPGSGIETAFDVFIGYLLFDAWIANQDRHHENWGLIAHGDGIHLAPTYDHAASMGQNETDAVRVERLNTGDKRRALSYYVARARSAIYGGKGDSKSLPTIDAFLLAASKRPQTAEFWCRQLQRITEEQCRRVFARFPAGYISPAGSEFALALLHLNKKRLIDRVFTKL